MQYRIKKSFILSHYFKYFILLYFYIKFFQNSENAEKVYNCDTSETWERNDKETESYLEQMDIIYTNFVGGVKGLARYGEDKLVVVGGGDTCKGFIKILDISDVNNIHQVATQIISDYMDRDSGLEDGRPRNVSLLGDFAFVAISGSGLMVVDLSKMDNYSNNYCRVGYYKESDIDDVKVYKRKKPGTEDDQIIAVLLVNYYGIKILDVTNPGLLQTASECSSTTSPCWNIKKQVEQGHYAAGSSSHLSSLEVVTDYWVDIDNDRRKGEEEDLDKEEDMKLSGEDITSDREKLDLVFFSIPSTGKLYIINISKLNGSFDRVPKYGEIVISDVTSLGDIYLDKESRMLYANDVSSGLVVVDMHLTDVMTLGEDSGERVAAVIPTKFNSKFGLTVDIDLNLAYVGDMDKGVNAIKLGNPKIKLVHKVNGQYIEVTKIAPSGIKSGDNPKNYPGTVGDEIYVMAFLPGGIGEQANADLWSLNPEGEYMVSWDTKFNTYIRKLPLHRMSPERDDEKYNIYLSDPIVVTLKASESENDLNGKKVLISGDWISVNLSTDVMKQLTYLTEDDCRSVYDRKMSIRADLVDRMENFKENETEKPNSPTNNPSIYSGVLLHSGEFVYENIDLHIPGRGFDFVFKRTYRSQCIYSGVLGWGWDHTYNRRLLELPGGDLIYFDGTGRRERYKAKESGGTIIGYESPAGRFTELKKMSDGTFRHIYPDRTIEFFDAYGRLMKIQDRNQNKMEFFYDRK